MGRMTEKDTSGRWQVKGIPWERLQEGQVITKEAGQILYGCLATAESATYIKSMLNELGKSETKVSDVLKEKTGKSFAELMEEGYSLGDCLKIMYESV